MRHEHGSYGHFLGGDPRRFSPDGEDSNSPGEIEAHKAACAAWDAAEKAGEPPPESKGACQAIPGVGFVTMSGFGLGVTTWDCDDPDCPDAQPSEDDDPEDASAAFARWERDAPEDPLATPDDRVREAFLAGWRARGGEA